MDIQIGQMVEREKARVHMRSIHLYFNEDTYKPDKRNELIERVKSILVLAGIEYSSLGAKGFNETSSHLNSYVKVVIKNHNA